MYQNSDSPSSPLLFFRFRSLPIVLVCSRCFPFLHTTAVITSRYVFFFLDINIKVKWMNEDSSESIHSFSRLHLHRRVPPWIVLSLKVIFLHEQDFNRLLNLHYFIICIGLWFVFFCFNGWPKMGTPKILLEKCIFGF